MPAAQQPGQPRRGRGTVKNPGDLTGREDERLRYEHADEIAQAAEHMATVQQGSPVNRSGRRQVHDYTDAARPKVEATPAEPAVPAKPREYVVRILADIDNMTFGKEVIFPGDFSDPANPQMPVLGSLKTYSFREGEEYKVDEPLYVHLRDLGYVYDI